MDYSECTCRSITMQEHLAEWSGRATLVIARLVRHGRAVPVNRVEKIVRLIQLLHDPERADAMKPEHYACSHHQRTCPWHPSNSPRLRP